ncbi:hypothetical protein Pint_27547 [Pistacia integerrima]|uniref:Uncharacterized protein n=1 Tax=Pistacia integerrima TaxID=434235 RepID=A0ACC0YQS3_9ROSI|nr:hypothetical protein Pint_27547 [Pistacia integerrima]
MTCNQTGSHLPSICYLFFVGDFFGLIFYTKSQSKYSGRARPLQNCGGGGTYFASIIFCRFSLKFT